MSERAGFAPGSDEAPSPAQRYALSRQRHLYPATTDFSALYPFELDPFQVDSCHALEDGNGVLVCAPTGAGKTVVGEFAVYLARATGQKCFYTTPIKALSNQKYADLVERYGSDEIGLLTGDNAVNANASIVVMTTEVLRNMLYVGSPALQGLGYVVMDEVHYLGDRFRGAVWEEAIIHLPESVALVSLSATVSNAEEFGDWLVSVRGDTTVVVHEQRPVPLWQHLLVGSRLFDLFDTDGPDQTRVDEQLKRYISERMRHFDSGAYGNRGRTGRDRSAPRGWRPPDRPEVIARLERSGLLPAITFIFSRAGCDAAVRQCLNAGVWLTSAEERDEIDALVEARTAALPADDLDVLGYWDWLDGLRRGVATHHAGMVPLFKETVEALFVRGLVKAVFATETLALGINMPARTVVLERLSKYNGETHADLTAGEFTQLTGRAGRRGIDVEGHAVVLWAPEIDPARLAGLASTRTYPLRSSFRPSYNMAVNLVAQLGRAPARQLLESSFAQFQADRSVVGLARQIQALDATRRELADQLQCEHGDFEAYAALRRELRDRETAASQAGSRTRHGALVAAMERLTSGDVVRLAKGRRAGLAVILDPGLSPHSDPRPLVVTQARWSGRLSALDFSAPIDVLGRLRVPRNFNHRSVADRRQLATDLVRFSTPAAARPSRRADGDPDPEITRLRAALRAHPCHGCADREEHARVAERHHRLSRERESLQNRMDGRTDSLGRAFDRICALLTDRGYLDGEETTPAGHLLSRIWSDSDLVVAECLRLEVWEGLDAAELASVVSSLVYEARRDERLVERMPSNRVAEAIDETIRVWGALADDEGDRGLPRSPEPELGFVWPAYRWCRRESLDRVLSATAEAGPMMSAGDFVRWCKQLIDLLGQIASAPTTAQSSTVPNAARLALSEIRRGVVAQSMLT